MRETIEEAGGSKPTGEVKTMSEWTRYPTVYEINTWVWLSDLERKYGQKVDLSSVPSSEWDAMAQYGFDAVWLMGVWERSPAGIAIANRNNGLLDDFRRALPDFRPRRQRGLALLRAALRGRSTSRGTQGSTRLPGRNLPSEA